MNNDSLEQLLSCSWLGGGGLKRVTSDIIRSTAHFFVLSPNKILGYFAEGLINYQALPLLRTSNTK